MATPTLADMTTSLEDARFFYERLDPIVRGPEEGQDVELIRRYFRGYLHCWKCILHFVREAKGLSGGQRDAAWTAWAKRWSSGLEASDFEVFELLRKTRDYDTHRGMIEVNREVAAGLFPIVMFQPAGSPTRRELISCCDRGLVVADHMIRAYPTVV